MSKYHIVSIDNDYGHINGVALYSSHDTEKEATITLEIVKNIVQQSHIDKANREKENYKRYEKWASQATVECPNGYGGFNWKRKPGDPHHLNDIKSIPYYIIRQYNGKTTIVGNLIEITRSEPLSLLEELVIPQEHYLEYHLVEPK